MQRDRVNDMIRISPLRVIGPNNEQLGVLELEEAKRLAREAGLDLVEVAADVRPPVCKIMDYGRHKYQQSKKEQKARAGAKKTELKEVRLGRSLRIGEHDVEMRLNQARAFLMEGHKVVFVQPFQGREMQHRESGYARMKDIEKHFEDIAKCEVPPKFNGKRMMMIMAPDRARIQAIRRAEESRRRNAQQREKAAAPVATAAASLTNATETPAPSPTAN